jgi:hypothetical protein
MFSDLFQFLIRFYFVLFSLHVLCFIFSSLSYSCFFCVFFNKFLNSELNIYFGPRFVIWPTTFDFAIYEKQIDL